MMTELFVLHPTFDALSAFADMPDVQAASSRVGRHVARCPECSATVEQIRRMGREARDAEGPAAPAGLWDRIASAAAEAREPVPARETPAPEASPWEAAPSMKPTKHWPVPSRKTASRFVAGVTLVAAALVAVLWYSGAETLNAGAPTRLEVTPARPAPGATMHVRYTPSPKLAGKDGLVLLGQYVSDSFNGTNDYYFGGQYDSLATLRRAADGAMVADIALPADFRAVSLVVADSTGRYFEADGLSSWIVAAGDAKGRPRLDAMLAGLSVNALYGSGARATLLDTLQKYFPDHPAGFATANRYRGEGRFAGLLKFFQGAERKYLQFDARLSKLPALDADRTTAMIDFAYKIEEPGEAAKWTRRLVREHPQDPRAIVYYDHMVHEVELKEPPRDSIRPLIPMLDTLYDRSADRRLMAQSDALRLVRTYGDSAMQRRWLLHALEVRGAVNRFFGVDVEVPWIRDAEIRRALERTARADADARCTHPRWLGRGWVGGPMRERICADQRGYALSTLAYVARYDGEPARALALADSAIAITTMRGSCWNPRAHRERGEALLVMGDTTAAMASFASALTTTRNWESDDLRRSLLGRLGARSDSASFDALVARQEAARNACASAARRRDGQTMP